MSFTLSPFTQFPYFFKSGAKDANSIPNLDMLFSPTIAPNQPPLFGICCAILKTAVPASADLSTAFESKPTTLSA